MKYWLVMLESEQLEVWSESECEYRLMKCEYYGARPFWQRVCPLSPPDPANPQPPEVGKIVPYKKAKIGRHFALILELFCEQGQEKFKGIDILTHQQIIAPI